MYQQLSTQYHWWFIYYHKKQTPDEALDYLVYWGIVLIVKVEFLWHHYPTFMSQNISIVVPVEGEASGLCDVMKMISSSDTTCVAEIVIVYVCEVPGIIRWSHRVCHETIPRGGRFVDSEAKWSSAVKNGCQLF